jgi:hypothetical protein
VNKARALEIFRKKKQSEKLKYLMFGSSQSGSLHSGGNNTPSKSGKLERQIQAQIKKWSRTYTCVCAPTTGF